MAAILLTVALHIVIGKQPTIVIADYSGTSEHWNIDLCVIDKGNTIIEVIPNSNFEFPKTIYLDVQSPDGNTYTTALHYIDTQNCYRYEHPTSSSIFNNVVDLIFTTRYGDETEQVELHRDNVIYYIDDYQNNDS